MGRIKIERPDAAAAKQMVQRLQKLDEQLNLVLQLSQACTAMVQQKSEELLQRQVQKTLEGLDVEELNHAKQGIRVAALREEGLTNIWQVHQAPLKQLVEIEGVGEKSAQKIRSCTRSMEKQVRQTTTVQLSADREDPVMEELVQQLYVLRHTKQNVALVTELLKQYHHPIEEMTAAAKPDTSWLGWMFASRAKKTACIEALNGLSAIENSGFPEESRQCVALQKQVSSVSPELRWQDYLEQPAAYIALLETYICRDVKSENEPYSLPEELAEQVESYGLDLSLLKATLRPYQLFACKYILRQKRVLLGDEMGLGKTIEAIGAMAALAAAGQTHFMVVCPASVLINWCREVPQHSQLTPVKLHGPEAEEALTKWVEAGGVAVTTFETVKKFQLEEAFRFAMLVVDEAHYVKNPEAQRTVAVNALTERAEQVLYMTGTPLENRVEEMCYLVKSLQPEVAKELEKMKFLSAAEQFREKLAPVYLRRCREDVLKELPELIETAEWCELSKAEKEAYKAAVKSDNFMAMRQVSWNTEDLRESAKAARLLELCQEAAEEKRKVIVFSFFRNTINKVCDLLGERAMGPITGSMAPQKRQELLDAFKAAPDGTVLVSQVIAGGTGLNIQSASVVIFCEPQMKPSMETQAIARAYRMGQLRSVLVYRLLCEDSVDERVMELLKEKQKIFDEYADESVVGSEQLARSEQEWITDVIAQEKERLAVEN